MMRIFKFLLAAAIIGWGGGHLDGGDFLGSHALFGMVCMGLGMWVLPPYPKKNGKEITG
jgi:hypothetical protein